MVFPHFGAPPQSIFPFRAAVRKPMLLRRERRLFRPFSGITKTFGSLPNSEHGREQGNGREHLPRNGSGRVLWKGTDRRKRLGSIAILL